MKTNLVDCNLKPQGCKVKILIISLMYKGRFSKTLSIIIHNQWLCIGYYAIKCTTAWIGGLCFVTFCIFRNLNNSFRLCKSNIQVIVRGGHNWRPLFCIIQYISDCFIKEFYKNIHTIMWGDFRGKTLVNGLIWMNLRLKY